MKSDMLFLRITTYPMSIVNTPVKYSGGFTKDILVTFSWCPIITPKNKNKSERTERKGLEPDGGG